MEFLVDLNRRCCKIEMWDKPNKLGKFKVDSYDDKVKLTIKEIRHIFDIVYRNPDLMAYPTCSMFGFSTVIQVYDVKKRKKILSFAHTQLLESYSQEKLIPYLKRPENKRRAADCGLNIDKLVEDHLPWSY